jgi:hypothetical protein
MHIEVLEMFLSPSPSPTQFYLACPKHSPISSIYSLNEIYHFPLLNTPPTPASPRLPSFLLGRRKKGMWEDWDGQGPFKRVREGEPG